MNDSTKANVDNRANQLNSNNKAYWSSRGTPRPSTGSANSGSGRGAKGGGGAKGGKR
jgi:hypothetical protein